MTSQRTAGPSETGFSAQVAEGRRARPVLWFAAAGAAVMALSMYVFLAWLTSDPARTPTGESDVPDYMKVTAVVLQIGAPLAGAWLLWTRLVRPWRRDGKPSLDGLLLVGLISLLWQDCMANYTQTLFTYNSYYVNRGSWIDHIPGWNTPDGGRFAQPVLITGVFYLVFAFAGMVFANAVMRRAKIRWPALGTAGLIGVAFATLAMVTLLFEPLFCYLGVWVYPGAPPNFSLFHGHYYQFPLYEPILWGAGWTSMAVLRYFKNDRGQSVAEFGIDRVRVSQRATTGLRLLAVIGALNLGYLLFDNIPYQWVGTHQHTWPQDIVSRTYFTQDRCGPGTEYECPGGKTPIFRPDGQHITPDGRVVEPDETKGN